MARPRTHTNIVEKSNEQTGSGNGETLLTDGYGINYYDCGGSSRTGVILEQGTENGQKVIVVNNSDGAESITFAAAGTSNVAGGTSIVIDQDQSRLFIYSEELEEWIPENTSDTTQSSLSGSSHYVVAAGQHTTAGGDANETASVSGVLATDIVVATLEDNGTNSVTLTTSAAAADQVDFVLSADPSTDAIINYVVYRAV